MANLEQIVSRKAENDTKWKEAQQAERENTTAMQDAGITEITSNPEAYARYLEMQGDNPSYSAGNIALVMFGNPEATVFGTRDRWKTLNRSVMDSEKNNGVKMLPVLLWGAVIRWRMPMTSSRRRAGIFPGSPCRMTVRKWRRR